MNEYYNTSSRMRVAQGDVRDEIRLPLYDSLSLGNADTATAAGYNQIRTFFQSTTTVGGGSKDLSQTNMRLAGTLESAVSFKMLGFSLDAMNPYSAAADTLAVLCDHSSLQLQIGEKQYWYGPMLFAVGRVYSPASNFSRFGDVAVAPVVFDAKHAVEINPQQNFKVIMTTTQVSPGYLGTLPNSIIPVAGEVRILASIKGLLRRPVQ